MKRGLILLLMVGLLMLTGCGSFKRFTQGADEEFGDQNFKSAIALIELHKVRNGTYPESLEDLEFTGQWDVMFISSVEYTKLEEGYELNLTRGWATVPEDLSYPPEFWEGLGLKKSNLKPE